jgi:hypothetical protein
MNQGVRSLTDLSVKGTLEREREKPISGGKHVT